MADGFNACIVEWEPRELKTDTESSCYLSGKDTGIGGWRTGRREKIGTGKMGTWVGMKRTPLCVALTPRTIMTV